MLRAYWRDVPYPILCELMLVFLHVNLGLFHQLDNVALEEIVSNADNCFFSSTNISLLTKYVILLRYYKKSRRNDKTNTSRANDIVMVMPNLNDNSSFA